jgi:hypothetical protein
MEVQVKCNFEIVYYDFWPDHTRCTVQSVDLALANKNRLFTFSGSKEQKEKTSEILFNFCGNVEFIPLKIFREFPNLKGISIWSSTLTSTMSNLFTNEFKKMQYVYLFDNSIQEIQENSFAELAELKWLTFLGNKITEIKYELFKNNSKLIYLNIHDAKFTLINPKLLKSIKNLILVQILGYVFKRGNDNFTSLNIELKPCYDKYLEVYGEEEENIEFFSEENKWKRKFEEAMIVSFYFYFYNIIIYLHFYVFFF